jgi:hypothetical protein
MPAIMTAGFRVVVIPAANPPYSRRRREQGNCSMMSSLVAAEIGLWWDDIPRPCHHPGAVADNDRHNGVPRLFGLALLAEAATLGIASYLHRGGHIPLGFTVVRGEQFTRASVPEAVIGAVLAAAAAIAATAPARARRAALFATAFAVFGVLVGVAFVVTSGRPSIAIDLAYHAILLAALTTTLVLLALRRPETASGQAPERQRVRSR